jgi:hypothetical protein
MIDKQNQGIQELLRLTEERMALQIGEMEKVLDKDKKKEYA